MQNLVNMLRGDPIGTYVELKRLLREEKLINRRLLDRRDIEASNYYLAILSEFIRLLEQTRLIVAVRPLRDGVISDFYTAEKMIEYFVKIVHQSPSRIPKVPRPRVVIGIPSGSTSVERKAVVDAARNAGAREVYLLFEPMAAAIGAGLDVTQPRGKMVVDMGGGTSEIAVISLGGLVVNKSIRIAGDEMDLEIVNYAKVTHDLLLGERTAEEVKFSIGNVYEFKNELNHKATLRGRDLKSGLPKTVDVSPSEIRLALRQPIKLIVNGIKDALEEIPADLMADVVEDGILLAGGTSLLRGLDKMLEEELRLPVKVADDPLTCVVRGCGKVLDDLELLHKVKV